MEEDGAGDTVHVLRVRGEERAVVVEGGRVVVIDVVIAIGRCEREEVVHGECVNLAAVRATIFDFGAAYRLVAMMD